MRFLSFSGRATRSEYWRYAWIPFLAVPVAGAAIFLPEGIVGFLYAAVLIQMVASPFWLGTTVRRLHDTGHSAWWLLPYAVIAVGWILIVAGFVSTLNDESYPTGFLIVWFSPVWALMNWAYVIMLLILCSGLGMVGSARSGPQPGVVEGSSNGDTELVPPKGPDIKDRKRFIKIVPSFAVFVLVAVVTALVLLAGCTALLVYSISTQLGEDPSAFENPPKDSCAGKITVANSSFTRMLVDECKTLVAVKDTLRGGDP